MDNITVSLYSYNLKTKKKKYLRNRYETDLSAFIGKKK